ncbi:uncharacterized protein LOC143213615 [Lasioglossum baleicum]|uniref:uncharacterized protein LOC143213615 n=1 Tax=Lasioglossum baleicum TaxID=434251 RepID=UPI003FCC9D53
MYVGGPLDTAPATPSSTPSRSQASHREVKVRKVNPSHSPSSLTLEYREGSHDTKQDRLLDRYHQEQEVARCIPKRPEQTEGFSTRS